MPKPCSKQASDEGLTFLGTLVALAVLVVAMGAAYPLLRAGTAALDRAARTARGARIALAVDASLRRLAGRVRPPFWVKVAPSAAGSTLETPWLDGRREAVASVSGVDGVLELRGPDSFQRFDGLKGVSVHWLEGTDGEALGFSLAFSPGASAWKIDAPFGALPFAAGEGP